MNFKIDLFLCIISPAAGARSAKRRVDLLYMECPVVGTQYKVLHGLIIDQRYRCFQPATIRRRRWLVNPSEAKGEVTTVAGGSICMENIARFTEWLLTV